ncbi:PhzF family phenazine biosynthesis protein [Actinophytocola oryzae]|uniref:PhzF family phenazine biosynthesis protein n=1 Tax=Actinophytocola oryzae TaxID=502181 RepID=A0A4V3FU65_9PSEU|nr:PhzF family phenazine biosynthesis isomerase [Actinophytocola oryzae]TDV53961.1 PhzF family phenazine biosynthesis protein [Actinophytocola oryzae]
MPEVLRYAAFTADPTKGNPAGVVLDAESMSDAEMQKTAADIGYSETAFVTEGFAVRYFSPLAEVPFCGHATIATAVALADRDGPGELTFRTKAGPIPVQTAIKDTTVATLASVATKSRPATPDEVTEALKALNWPSADLHEEWPAHVSFAGNDHLMLAASSRARLATLDYDFEALKALMQKANWVTVHLFWPESKEKFHARDPFPVGGVVEDPATGAAAAAFGGYLRTLSRIPTPTNLTIIQGEDMGRRSELTIEVDPTDPRVRVTGTATKIVT